MTKQVAIVGAGPVGCLLSIYLVRRGFSVSVLERRPDMRIATVDAGRSINLALSSRGLRPLEELGLATSLKNIAIPMHGRMMHDVKGGTSFLPYGRQGQYINSISRSALNIALINEAETAGTSFQFQQRVTDVDPETCTIRTDSGGNFSADVIIGADGAFSATRAALKLRGSLTCSEEPIAYGYKELAILPGPDGFRFDKNALHIWPRESYMLIALPNPDGSFTCTLFLAFEGDLSFAALASRPSEFFRKTFPDAHALMPDFDEQWKMNPVSNLVTVKSNPWSSKNVVLIGDAAHAVVPFYGQGMNAGFEDCRILNNLLHEYNDRWSEAIPAFEALRKPDADAIATLALDNFVEMRDLVATPEFLLRKQIEAKLQELHPDKWIPLYSMVTFESNLRYSAALEIGRRQKAIMDKVLRMPGIESTWHELDFDSIVKELAK